MKHDEMYFSTKEIDEVSKNMLFFLEENTSLFKTFTSEKEKNGSRKVAVENGWVA